MNKPSLKLKNNKLKVSSGFTLIETVVYLALFSLFIGGAVVTAYNMFELGGRSQTKSILQEEGDFLQGKIEWALDGAQSVASPPMPTPPAVFTQSSILSVAKYDGTAINIKLSGTDILLQNALNTYPFNNSSVKISQLVFTHNDASGDGVSPESLQADFTLTANTPNGTQISQDFSTIKYLRK